MSQSVFNDLVNGFLEKRNESLGTGIEDDVRRFVDRIRVSIPSLESEEAAYTVMKASMMGQHDVEQDSNTLQLFIICLGIAAAEVHASNDGGI